jgi:hypothetical protein
MSRRCHNATASLLLRCRVDPWNPSAPLCPSYLICLIVWPLNQNCYFCMKCAKTLKMRSISIEKITVRHWRGSGAAAVRHFVHAALCMCYCHSPIFVIDRRIWSKLDSYKSKMTKADGRVFVGFWPENWTKLVVSKNVLDPINNCNMLICNTCITKDAFPFRGKSQHQSTDLHGATQTRPFRDWLWIWCLVSKIRYNVGWGLPNLIAADRSAVNE